MTENLLLIDFDNLFSNSAAKSCPVPPSWIIAGLSAIAITQTRPNRIIGICSQNNIDELLSSFFKKYEIEIIREVPDTSDIPAWSYLGYHSDLLEMQVKPWTIVLEPNDSLTDLTKVSYKEVLTRWGGTLENAKEVYQLSKVLPRADAARIIARLGSITGAKNNIKKVHRIWQREAIESLVVEPLSMEKINPGLHGVQDTPSWDYTSSISLRALLPWTIPLDRSIKEIKSRRYILVNTEDLLKEIVNTLHKYDRVAVDCETTGLDVVRDSLVGISLSAKEGEAYYLPVSAFNPEVYFKNVSNLLGDPGIKKVIHNAAFDLEVLANNGIDVAGLDFDTMLAAYVLSHPRVGLKFLAANRLKLEMTTYEDLLGESKTIEAIPPEVTSPYACADADMTMRLYRLFEVELRAQDKLYNLFELEMRIMHILRSMTRHGFYIDSTKLATIDSELLAKVEEAEQSVYDVAGKEFNIDSVPQLNEILFDDLDLRRTRTTETGLHTTNKLALEGLINDHEVISKILYYRRLSDLREHMQRIAKVIDPLTGCIHTEWRQALTKTGRLSSSPNLQNIPAPGDDEYGEVGYLMRSVFTACKSDRLLVGSDFSQLEVRLIAHFSQDAGLLAGYNGSSDFDVHTYVASVVNGIPESEVTPDQRRQAKPANFGVSYGLTEYGYSIRAKVSKEEAKKFIDSYFAKFPGIKQYQLDVVEKARKLGYAETLSGRRRYFTNLDSPDTKIRSAAERECINLPIQGTAADIVKMAMDAVEDKIKREGLDAWFVSQVHDEIILDSHPDHAQRVAAILNETLPYVVKLDVPLEVSTKIGKNWAEIH